MVLYTVIGLHAELKPIYFMFLFAASGLFVYQQVLIKNYNPTNCLKAFKNNNQFGMLIFLGIVLGS